MVGQVNLRIGLGIMGTGAERALRMDMEEALERGPIREGIPEKDLTLEGIRGKEAIQEEILEKVLTLAEPPEKEAGYLKVRSSLRV